MRPRLLSPFAALILGALLAGCAQSRDNKLAEAQGAASTQAEAPPEAVANVAEAAPAEPSTGAPDLLAQARAIAAAKGLGEAPGAQDAARQALQMAVAARVQNERPAPASTARDLADVNERIRLAALRLRAEATGATPVSQPAKAPDPQAHERAQPREPADDPQEIFRRARERHLSARAAQAAPFGGLTAPQTTVAMAPPAPAQSYFIEAVRRKEAARADENVFTLAR